MDFEEYEKLAEEGTKGKLITCEICGAVFKPRTSTQKVCPNPACRREAGRRRQRKHYANMSDEEKAKLHNKQAVYQRQKRVEAKNKEVRFRNADKIREHWERVQRFDKIVELYGSNYGEYQKKKILENVPKIDVEGFLKEINKGEKDV